MSAPPTPPSQPHPKVHAGAEPAPGRPSVASETGRLRVCVGFAPGAEFDFVLPRHIEPAVRGSDGALRDNPDYLLFDDLVLREVLTREHRRLFDVVRAVAHVHDLRDLITDVLEAPSVRAAVVDEVARTEATAGRPLSQTGRDWLLAASSRSCVAALLSGEIPGSPGHLPMPNWLFARDCLAVVGEAVVTMRPRHPARWRDGVLARAVVAHHPLFAGARGVDVAEEAAALGLSGPACVEGGDVLTLSPSLALVGVGRRTTEAGAHALATALRRETDTEVLAVRLPDKRAAMHLDTVFTLLDRDLAVAYAPLLHGDAALQVYDPTQPPGRSSGGQDLLAALAERGRPLEVLPCGDGEPRAALREQWTDGANAFCLAPGRVVLYGRNRATLRALNRRGFRVVAPADFIANAPLWMSGDERVVVAIDGFELSRGRGGPRCLTLPVQRDA